MPLPVTYHPLRTLRFYFLVAFNSLPFLTVLPNETLTLTLTSERRGQIQNKEGYFQFTGNLNHKKKTTHAKDYITARNYCQSNSAHNDQRTAKPEKPLDMQQFKKSESLSFLNMTTQKGNVVRLPLSYSYFDPRKGWKCTQKSSMFIESTESYHPLTGKRLCCHFSPPLQPGFVTWQLLPSLHRQLVILPIWYMLVLLLWCCGK